jgi:CBS domain-containing protein
MPNRTVREIVAKQKVVTAPSKTTVDEAARLMEDKEVGALLVMDRGRLVGIFTERDALFRVLAAGRDPRITHLSDVMTRDPQSIHPDKAFGHAMLMMYEGGFRHVPVVEKGHPLGVVSARDVLGPELQEFASELSNREHIREILG